MERTGIFVGSFNPFTIGHDSIVRRALPLFDRLVIGVMDWRWNLLKQKVPNSS